jgi:aerobic carbon-monoxide dehydrogenase medium subunit
VITQPFDYESPATLREALALLADGESKVLAGGMSLVPMMKLRLASPGRVVDLGRVAGLREIREEGGTIRIGAMTTHHQVESSPLVRGRAPLLAETASHIGDIQIRNMGTIGGSIAHADPAADYPAALLALDASVVVASSEEGERTVAIGDFFVDTFATALEPGEIVIEVRIPVEAPSEGYRYEKVEQTASGFALVGIAARIRKQDGKISLARVGVTGLAPRPFRATNVEAALVGTPGEPEDLRRAALVIGEGEEINTDLHASSDYRRQLARVHAARALASAVSRAS